MIFVHMQVVKFQVNDQLLTSSPSDSNNSTDSGAGSSTNELKIVASARRLEIVFMLMTLWQPQKCDKFDIQV